MTLGYLNFDEGGGCYKGRLSYDYIGYGGDEFSFIGSKRESNGQILLG